MKWQDKAKCLNADPELFFPVGTSEAAEEQIAAAKAVCSECEVTEECLDYALETNQQIGIWGGMTEEERRSLSRRLARAKRAEKTK